MPLLYLIMESIRKHYDRVSVELVAGDDENVTLPSRVHAIVLVSKIHKPTLRALAYARATRPTVLEAVTVDVDDDATARLIHEWERRGIPVPLKVLDSPYREITRPVVEYVRGLNRSSPRDLVCVYVPEYVVGPLVGAAAAQPERAAPEDPAAVLARGDGGQRPVAAAVQRADRRRARGSGARCPAARRSRDCRDGRGLRGR